MAHGAGEYEQARLAYEDCQECLERLRRNAVASAEQEQVDEYRGLLQEVKNRTDEIDQSIADARDTHEAETHVPWISGESLYFVPVIGPIAAGTERISLDDIEQYVAIAGNQVVIDGRTYCFRRCHSSEGSVIRLGLQQYDYYLSEVIGYSMNQADIEDGDYVLLRQPRGLSVAPNSQDIVAAAIKDVDNEATLKRYIEEDDKIILRPESSDSSLEPHEFSEEDEKDKRLTIVAVAVATLKPV
jgi:SOS-response transcriptional repressor LexA